MSNIKQNSPENKNTISIKNITLNSWLILATFFFICFVGLWQLYKPFLAELHFRNGYNYDMRNQMQFAVDEYGLAVKYAPWETHYWQYFGKTFEKNAPKFKDNNAKIKLLTAAANIYHHIIKIDPQNPWYQNRAAVVYYELEKIAPTPEQKQKFHKLSKKHTQAAATLDSQNPLFQLNLAYFMHRNDKKDEALALYKKVAEMDGSMAEARFNLASLYRERKENDKALDQLIKIFEKKPSFQNVDLTIASLYIVKGQSEKALPYLKSRVTREPGNIEALKNIAAISLQNKKYYESALYYKRLITIQPSLETSMHELYIKALFHAGRFKAALDSLNAYLIKYPNNTVAKKQQAAIQSIFNKSKK